MKSIIETKDLRKVFPKKGRNKAEVEAVHGASFQVEDGEIFGFLGPNGAGKTTTMRMLCTLLTPTSGQVIIAGSSLENPKEIRKNIGYVSQVGGMLREASGRENLMLQGRMYGMKETEAKERVDELLKLLNIEDFADRRTGTYSGGQRRIFDLASGIIHRPKLLFLDEPSTGLDPQNRAHVWEQVKKLNKEGTTIFLTTHYLEEADALCSRVAIMDQGNIVALGTPQELKQKIAGDVLSLEFADATIALDAKNLLKDEKFIKETEIKGEFLQLFVDKGDENLPLVIAKLHDKKITARSIKLARPTLDDVFLKLTGRNLSESEI